VQATAAGLGFALSGTLRDVAGAVTRATTGVRSEASGYLIVYGLEIFLLCLTVIAIMPLLRRGQPIAATAGAEAVADAPSAQT
jgi:BCD family chlorophyll transporter-like MFS transporter